MTNRHKEHLHGVDLAEAMEHGLVLGVGFGVFIGNVLIHNVGLGIVFGIGVGPLLGLAWSALLNRLLPRLR